MPFESAENKQPHERAVFFVPRDELVTKQFEELLIVTGFGELPGFLARYTSAREGQGGLLGTVFMAKLSRLISSRGSRRPSQN